MASSIQTGSYVLINVRYSNVAFIGDANDESDVVAITEETQAGEKWDVTLLNNKKYTIKNNGFASHATSGSRPEKGDNIRGRQRQQQWTIKETKTKGRFTISTTGTGTDLFWGVTDGESNTPITLADADNDTKNQWTFRKSSN